MAKLIAFYSRADENYFGGERRYVSEGNTEKVAKIIGGITGADLFKIEQKEPYAADYDTCVKQTVADFRANARPELANLPESVDMYDEIYLGFPIYCGDMPMAVYTFLDAFDWTGKTIHPFCTHEGSGMGKIPSKIAAACAGADVKGGLAVKGSEADESRPEVLEWLSGR